MASREEREEEYRRDALEEREMRTDWEYAVSKVYEDIEAASKLYALAKEVDDLFLKTNETTVEEGVDSINNLADELIAGATRYLEGYGWYIDYPDDLLKEVE